MEDTKKTKISTPSSRFLEIMCRNCGEKTIIFDKASNEISCGCGEVLVIPTGGYARIRGKILQEMD